MNREPSIDIIIPIYNSEKFLGQTLNSLIIQTYKNFKILCYNDGSSDKSEALIKEYIKKDRRIKLLGSKRIGLVNSLNFLVKSSKSELIVRIDSDDICEKNRLEMLVNYHIKNNADIYYSNYTLINENGSFLFPFIKIAPHHNVLEKFMRWRNPICHPTVMYKRSIFKKVSYNSDYIGAEDYRFWADCLAINLKFIKVPYCLVRYRVHKNQITQKNSSSTRESATKIIAYLRKLRPSLAFDTLLDSYSKNKNISNLSKLIFHADSNGFRFRMLLNFFFAR
jgi:glycosyltransferase involved in cell wall biosynthesis